MDGVESWAIQLQGLEDPARMARLRESAYDLVVVDRVSSVRGMQNFDTKAMVRSLRAGGRLCLAYFNVGQAENYRTYWRPEWRAPTQQAAGDPPFLLTVDPEGWVGDYPVAFWSEDWLRILMEQVDVVVAQGFDGIYCDWVLGYAEPKVAAAARAAGVDPAGAMAALLRDLRARARRTNPRFVLVMQNAGALFDRVPDLAQSVDGYSQEPLSFSGDAGAKWDEPNAGDIAIPARGGWSTAAMLARLRRIRARGIRTFTIDYALDSGNARVARERARSVGAVPFVTRVSLDRLP
jgi:cysteinyl-tRNA synthetase